MSSTTPVSVPDDLSRPGSHRRTMSHPVTTTVLFFLACLIDSLKMWKRLARDSEGRLFRSNISKIPGLSHSILSPCSLGLSLRPALFAYFFPFLPLFLSLPLPVFPFLSQLHLLNITNMEDIPSGEKRTSTKTPRNLLDLPVEILLMIVDSISPVDLISLPLCSQGLLNLFFDAEGNLLPYRHGEPPNNERVDSLTRLSRDNPHLFLCSTCGKLHHTRMATNLGHPAPNRSPYTDYNQYDAPDVIYRDALSGYVMYWKGIGSLATQHC